MHIKVSKGNIKVGDIPSISFPTGLTCRNDCKGCYAKRLEQYRWNARKAYETNWKVYESNPELFWREVEAVIMMSRFFRFHVSGDIPDESYFEHMLEVAERNPHCEIVCFTKKYCKNVICCSTM